MRITFICGALQPGKNGVGDYSRRLAAQLIEKGHQISIISLYDSYIETSTQEQQQESKTEVPVLRLPDSFTWKKRVILAKAYIDNANPEWLSLQFVPFAFQHNGLPFRLGHYLTSLGKKRKWHIMFHEVWAGRGSLSRRIVFHTQKYIIWCLLSVLKPRVCHTHLPLYKARLQQLRTNSKIAELPLFSNIPSDRKYAQENDDDIFRIVFFSQVAVTNSIIHFLSLLLSEVKEALRQKAEIIFIGSPDKTKASKHVLEKQLPPGIPIRCAGFLSPEEVSRTLYKCNLGVTPVAQNALGKSGSVAAFFEHSLPVAAPFVINTFSKDGLGFFSPVLQAAVLTKPCLSLLAASKEAAAAASNEISIEHVAGKFLQDLI